MPYIKMNDRFELSDNERKPKNAGELNYTFTVIIKDYIRNIGEKYQTYNDIIGALEGCKLELYRRMVSPYEDLKVQENGDVF